MNFLKKNYEKILLGVVLLGLFGAVLLLPVVIAADEAALKGIITSIQQTPPKPLPPLDMSGTDFENTIFEYSPVTDFGVRYRDRIVHARAFRLRALLQHRSGRRKREQNCSERNHNQVFAFHDFSISLRVGV